MPMRLRDLVYPVIAFLVVLAFTASIIVFYPRKYQSRAKLLLKLGRENLTLDPTVTTTGETLSLYRTRESEIMTTLETMKNRAILSEVASRVGYDTILDGLPPNAKSPPTTGVLSGLLRPIRGLLELDPVTEEEAVLLELESGLTLETARESGVVEVRYVTKSPEVAQEVVATWTEVYRHLHARLNQTQGTSQFFAGEEEAIRDRLLRAREDLRRAKNDAHLVTVEGQQDSFERQFLTVRQATMETEALLAASIRRKQLLDELESTTPERLLLQEASVANHAHELMRDTLFQLELVEKELNAKYSEDHPKLKAIRAQREQAERILNDQNRNISETTQSVNPVSQFVQQQLIDESANVGALTERLRVNEAQLAMLNDELLQLNQREQEIVQLETELKQLEIQYTAIVEKREQAKLSDALEAEGISSINTVQPATFEARPATPNKKICAILGVLAALSSGLGVHLLRQGLLRFGSPQLAPPAQDGDPNTTDPVDVALLSTPGAPDDAGGCNAT